MEFPTIPAYEKQRLQALKKLNILDTAPEEGFDRLTRLVRTYFDVSVAQINLIDTDRVWMKSTQGVRVTEIPRDSSFCAHTILAEDILCVLDTQKDPRFEKNMVVLDEGPVRFYVGIPLAVYGGFNIGTLCIMCSKPRKFSAKEYDVLKDFARSAEQQFSLSKLQDDGTFLISQTSRLNSLLEAVADGIVTIDNEGVIESLNSAAAHIFGYEQYELVGTPFDQLMPNIEESGWQAYLEKLLNPEEKINLEEISDQQGVRKDGAVFPMDLRVREMQLEGKRLYTGIIRDITERRAVQDEIRLGHEILEATKENIPVGLSVFDANYCLKVVNSQTSKFLNLPANLVRLGTPFRDIMAFLIARGDFGKWSTDRQKRELEEMIAHPRSQRFARVVQSDRLIEISGASMPGGGFVSTYMDITARLKYEEKLESLLQQANDANEAKSNFLSTVSHEIRTPLNGVIGVAQLLEDTDLNSDQRRKLETILHSGNTLLELINDVLDMSKIESGNLEIEEIICDLSELIQSIKTPFELQAKNKGIEFLVEIDTGLAPYIITDPTRLRQIIMNLLGNAMKFTEKGSVRITVHAKKVEHSVKEHVIISVSDTGVGIPVDRQQTIFNAFSQADNTVSRKFGGTGLGLSIVQNLVAMMGGKISVKSTVGKGACFEVTFDFALPTNAEIAEQKRKKEIVNVTNMGSLKVLIVEDNHVNSMITREFLKKLGHVSESAENGLLAVQKLDFDTFDLVLMDVHMPVMDGIEATRQIRQKSCFADLPIIGVTAEAFTDRHAHMKKVGMNDILTKPFTKAQLENVIYRNFRTVDKPLEESNNMISQPNIECDSSLAATMHFCIGSDEKMDEFIDQLGPEVTQSLIGKTPDAIMAELNTLYEGLSLEDTSIVYRAVHTIVGVASSMCAERLAKQASILEQMAENLVDIKKALPMFEQTAKETIKWWNLKLKEVS